MWTPLSPSHAVASLDCRSLRRIQALAHALSQNKLGVFFDRPADRFVTGVTLIDAAALVLAAPVLANALAFAIRARTSARSASYSARI
ncbi:hypothetical protein CH294_04405 [Rhodococcus sp. 14-2483-1-1]|nr:hypothetical protein CH294_04405 [Rhodococcus sp. 14-2483-1-1]